MSKKIVVKAKQVNAFREGLKYGATAYALGSDFSKNSYLRLHETKAYNTAYEMACCKDLSNVWKATPDSMTEELWLLRHCVDNNLIKSDGWKINGNSLNNRYVEYL
jgi:hypothetical protein